ncbi:MAG: MerR family transcriptional regulator [Clostridia bacterium]|nr:MerR family transcriptional regulator [Clostridia bacterium]
MTIRQVCERSGLPKETIRYYERVGLISAKKGNYFKSYDWETVEMLIAIKRLRIAGLSISEIKKLVSMEIEYREMSREQRDLVIRMIDNAMERTQNRASEIAEAQRLLERMQSKLEQVRHENC